MCIFCGGLCGGSGDQVLITVAALVPLAIVKARSVRGGRKNGDSGVVEDGQSGIESVSEEQDTSS
jgi:hypothetical protein